MQLLQSGGLLVRLCYAEEEEDEKVPPPRHKTTSDWNKYLQSLQEQDLNTSDSQFYEYLH